MNVKYTVEFDPDLLQDQRDYLLTLERNELLDGLINMLDHLLDQDYHYSRITP